jgi:hypothetical protein
MQLSEGRGFQVERKAEFLLGRGMPGMLQEQYQGLKQSGQGGR